jgi:hypothetical protein
MALLACGYAHTMVIVGAGKCGSVLTCGRAVAGQLGQEGTASGGGTLAAVTGPLAQVCDDINRGRQLARCASAYSPRRLVCAQKSAGPARTHACNPSNQHARLLFWRRNGRLLCLRGWRTRWRSANSAYAIAGAPGLGVYINRSVPCAPKARKPKTQTLNSRP